MGSYPGLVGTGTEINGEGQVISGNVSYTHTEEKWGNSDIGVITFQDGLVVETKFLPD